MTADRKPCPECGVPMEEQRYAWTCDRCKRVIPRAAEPAPGDDRICPLCLTPGMAFAGDQWAECHHCGVYCSKSQDEQLAAAQSEIERLNKEANALATECRVHQDGIRDRDTLLTTMAQALEVAKDRMQEHVREPIEAALAAYDQHTKGSK